MRQHNDGAMTNYVVSVVDVQGYSGNRFNAAGLNFTMEESGNVA